MSNTRTDPGFDQNDVIEFTPAQIAEDVMRLANNVIEIMKRINRSGVISDMDLKSIQRCHSAIQAWRRYTHLIAGREDCHSAGEALG